MGIEAQVVPDLATSIVAQLAASATGRSWRPGAGAADWGAGAGDRRFCWRRCSLRGFLWACQSHRHWRIEPETTSQGRGQALDARTVNTRKDTDKVREAGL